MTTIADEITARLQPLVGLRLSIARRAADMRGFHFGQVCKVEGGTVGKYALHIQCPWRVEGPQGIVTGRLDLREPAEDSPDIDWETWDYEEEESKRSSTDFPARPRAAPSAGTKSSSRQARQERKEREKEEQNDSRFTLGDLGVFARDVILLVFTTCVMLSELSGKVFQLLGVSGTDFKRATGGNGTEEEEPPTVLFRFNLEFERFVLPQSA